MRTKLYILVNHRFGYINIGSDSASFRKELTDILENTGNLKLVHTFKIIDTLLFN